MGWEIEAVFLYSNCIFNQFFIKSKQSS